jgi:hypothetical protein
VWLVDASMDVDEGSGVTGGGLYWAGILFFVSFVLRWSWDLVGRHAGRCACSVNTRVLLVNDRRECV